MTRRIVDPTSGSTQDVDFAVPNVRIVFGSETRDGLVLLPIAQLVREPGGRVCVRHAFVPPVLRLGASPALNGGLARVVGAISARQRELASARKRRSSTSIEFHSSDAPRFWMLHTLSASLPVLKHLLDSERAHPEEVYLALVSLVGQLETFAPGEGEALPAFNYLALGQVFEAIFGRVLSLLAADAAPTFSQVPLQHRADGAFMGKIADRGLLNCDFFVGIDSGQPEPALRERVPQILKIAAWNQIYEIVKQARHGVRVEVDWHPSASLPLQPGRCFFRLRREGAFWEEIAKTGTIALYLPADSDWKDASVSVYAVRAEQTK